MEGVPLSVEAEGRICSLYIEKGRTREDTEKRKMKER